MSCGEGRKKIYGTKWEHELGGKKRESSEVNRVHKSRKHYMKTY